MGIICTKTTIVRNNTFIVSSGNIVVRKYELDQLYESTNISNKSINNKQNNDKNIPNLNNDNDRGRKKDEYLITFNSEFHANVFIDEINKSRQNCKAYSFNILQLKNRVKFDDENYENFLIMNNKRVNLTKGKINFDYSSKYLNELYFNLENKFKNLKNFEIINEMKIPFPDEEDKNPLEKTYVSSCVDKLKKKFEGKYEIIDYFFEICLNDPEIFTFLNAISEFDEDDEYVDNKKMLKLMFNEEIKYISINHKKLDEDKCLIYLLFAK